MNKLWLLVVVLMVVVSPGTTAATAEDAIEFRQGIFRALEWNLREMGAMMQGRTPFDGARFALQAKRVEQLAQMPREGFVEGSDRRARVQTRARGEIWYQGEAFNRLMAELGEKSAALARAAPEGEREALRPLFGQLAQTCKRCHDRYRTRD